MLGLEDVDELTHEPDPDPAWRESFFFDLVDDSTGTGLIAYCGAQPGAGTGYGMIHLAGRDGVIHRWQEHGLGLDGHAPGLSTVRIGPATVVTEQPQRMQSLHVDTPECVLDLSFSSDLPIYDYPWWIKTRSRHYEQFGTAEATVRVTGAEPLVLRGGAARDHAWGLRSLYPFSRWLWMTFRADGVAWSLCWKETATGETDVYGHLVDDGGGVHLARALTTDLEFADGRPTGGALTVTFGRLAPLTYQFGIYGLLDVSNRDPAKPGAYFFAFHEGDCDGRHGVGVFDVFWRPEFGEPRQVQAGG